MIKQKMLNGYTIPLTEHEVFEIESKRVAWMEKKGDRIRVDRDSLLLTVDAIAGNVLRWAALDADTQAAWAAYRQALLDVPQQAGFPNDVTWPEEPSS